MFSRNNASDPHIVLYDLVCVVLILFGGFRVSWDSFPAHPTMVERSESHLFSSPDTVCLRSMFECADSLAPAQTRYYYRVWWSDYSNLGPSVTRSGLGLVWGDTSRALERWHTYVGIDSSLLLVTYLPEPMSWEVSWILTDSLEEVTFTNMWDITGDGWVGLSDLSYFGQDYNLNGDRLWDLSDFTEMGGVYNGVGRYIYVGDREEGWKEIGNERTTAP